MDTKITSGAVEERDKPFYTFWYGHMLGDVMTGALADVKHSTARYIWDAATATPPTAPVAPTYDLDSALYDAMAEQLGGLYSCGRVWSAWSVGTMSENDFQIASEDDDIISNFVQAARAAIHAASVAASAASVPSPVAPENGSLADKHNTIDARVRNLGAAALNKAGSGHE